jgi:hypothetical protein
MTTTVRATILLKNPTQTLSQEILKVTKGVSREERGVVTARICTQICMGGVSAENEQDPTKFDHYPPSRVDHIQIDFVDSAIDLPPNAGGISVVPSMPSKLPEVA